MTGESTIRRSGFVAVAGRPNAGKSTLVNQLSGAHVAIVSPIAQTTRRVVRAVANHGDAQIVLVDLPGSQRPVDRMTERMQHAVERGVGDVEAVVWVIDMSVELGKGERAIGDMVLGHGRPVIIAANKVDRIAKQSLLARMGELSELIGERDYAAIVPISATAGEGCDTLLELLAELMPEGPAYFPEDETTDQRAEELIAEYVREASLALLREELPHASGVEIDELEEHDDGLLHIECTIWVEAESQVGIVVGAGGATVKEIGTRARATIETEFERKCFLRIRVKARPKWRDDEGHLARMGL